MTPPSRASSVITVLPLVTRAGGLFGAGAGETSRRSAMLSLTLSPAGHTEQG